MRYFGSNSTNLFPRTMRRKQNEVTVERMETMYPSPAYWDLYYFMKYSLMKRLPN